MFFVKLLFSRTKNKTYDPLDDAYRQAAKAVCVAWLITATTSGALIDLWPPLFCICRIGVRQAFCSAPPELIGLP